MSLVSKPLAALASFAFPFFTGCAPTEGQKDQQPALEQRIVEEEGALLKAKKAIEEKQPEQAIALLEGIKNSSFEYHVLRAKGYSLLADNAEVPQVFDSGIPTADMVRQIKDASRKKHDLYESAISSYKRAKEISDDICVDKMIAATYWRRHLALFAPVDAKIAENGFLDVIKRDPAQSDAYALLGGIYVWYAKATTDAAMQKKFISKAYWKFIEAKTRHEKQPLDDKMLRYVDESIEDMKAKVKAGEFY